MSLIQENECDEDDHFSRYGDERLEGLDEGQNLQLHMTEGLGGVELRPADIFTGVFLSQVLHSQLSFICQQIHRVLHRLSGSVEEFLDNGHK